MEGLQQALADLVYLGWDNQAAVDHPALVEMADADQQVLDQDLNWVSPLATCSLLMSHPLRNRERSLRCLRRLRYLTNRTTETRRFSSRFHVHLTRPRKNGRVRTAFT